MRRGHREAGHLCVCQGLEGVVMELMLWVEGLLGPLYPLCSSGQAWPISLVVGPWHLNIPLCYFHTKRSSGLPQAQPLSVGVIGLGPCPPSLLQPQLVFP